MLRCDLSRGCHLRYADDRRWDGLFLAFLGADVAPRVPIGYLSNLLVPYHKRSRIIVLQTGPSTTVVNSVVVWHYILSNEGGHSVADSGSEDA